MKQKHTSNIPVGPPSKSPCKTLSEMSAAAGRSMSADLSTDFFSSDDDNKAMSVDTSLVATDNMATDNIYSNMFPDEALLPFIGVLAKKLHRWDDNGTDTAINDVLQTVFVCLVVHVQGEQGCPPSFLAYEGQFADQEQFLNNVKVAKERDPDFFKSLGEAIRGHNTELWHRVLMNGIDLRWTGLSSTHSSILHVFHTTMMFNKSYSSFGSFSELQEQGNSSRYHSVVYSNIPHFLAVVQSWTAPFVRRDALDALIEHIDRERKKKGAYAPFCSIVQSSGMGKSRLLDELSKTYFLIPVNLCTSSSTGAYPPFHLSRPSQSKLTFLGHPPADVSVRDLLTASKSARDAYPYLWFLLTLFTRTTRVIMNLKHAPN